MTEKKKYNLRILMIIPRLRSGGAERQLGYLSRRLAELGHSIVVATLEAGESPPPDWHRNIRFEMQGGGGNYDPRLFPRLYRLIRKVQPDIVQTWNPQTDILGGLAAICNSRPWVIREPISADFYRTGWEAKFRARLAGKCAAVIANSAGGADYWRFLYPNKPRYVVPNGIPFPEIRRVEPASREKLGIRAGQKFILYAGRITRQKRVDRIIDAVAAILPEGDLKLFICGKGEDLEKLKTQSREQGMADRIVFLGFLEIEKIWSMMKSADLFISLSDFEGMPNTVMEAMACGCPVLASDIPSHREILDRDTGRLVDPDNGGAVAREIAFLLSAATDPAARARVSAAREKARTWSVSGMVKSYDDIFREMFPLFLG